MDGSEPQASKPADTHAQDSDTVCDMCGKQIPPPGEGESATCDDCIEVWFDVFVMELISSIWQLRGLKS